MEAAPEAVITTGGGVWHDIRWPDSWGTTDPRRFDLVLVLYRGRMPLAQWAALAAGALEVCQPYYVVRYRNDGGGATGWHLELRETLDQSRFLESGGYAGIRDCLVRDMGFVTRSLDGTGCGARGTSRPGDSGLPPGVAGGAGVP